MSQQNPTTSNDPQVEQILQRVDRFRDRGLAFSYAARPGKRLWVMLGDDEKFWVARPVDCAKLERAGYEFAD